MNDIKCGKLISGEFFIGTLTGEETEGFDKVLCFENLSNLLLNPTQEEGKIQINTIPMNPFCKKNEIIKIHKSKILFFIDDIPEVVSSQYLYLTTGIMVPKLQKN